MEHPAEERQQGFQGGRYPNKSVYRYSRDKNDLQ